MTGRPHLVVIGPPGVGKSTVAARVAQALGRPVVDSDRRVEERAGREVSEIFLDLGEGQFRAWEAEAVLAALDEEGVVLSLGGGAPMTPQVADALAGHRVVLLEVGIADAARRIGLDQSRPLLAVNPRAAWLATVKERRPTYERLATWRVETTGRSVDEVVDEVLALLAEAGEEAR